MAHCIRGIVGPLHKGIIGPLHKEIIDPLHNGIIGPLHKWIIVPLHKGIDRLSYGSSDTRVDDNQACICVAFIRFFSLYYGVPTVGKSRVKRSLFCSL